MSTFQQADWPEKIRYMNEYDNFARLYGIRLVDYNVGFAHMQMEVQAQSMYLNSQGRIHGGWLSAMLVIAGGKAARSYGQEVRIIELTMNYYRGVSGGLVNIFATEKHRNCHIAVYDVEMRTADGKLVVAGVTTFVLLDEPVSYHLLPKPTATHSFAREFPIWPEERADLHAEIPGLRACFRDSDWPAKRVYMNENENLFYSENITVTEYGKGLCRAKLDPLLPRHFDARGKLEPAWLAVVMDPTIGKPSLSMGEFSLTAQMSISFFSVDTVGGLFAEGHERSRGEHFSVCEGEILDSRGQLLASGACTMYLRHTEIDFRREHPLNYPEGPEGA
ncbi:MAG TPA: PaaI family thioesterase [Candidatus Avidehalobacter gallistercoris]|uniref:PaaI family thioesterase n=1 Tax=Candidatus Avidehalobacter gallistercoris TaxID=2840694 RepID=A0A9D1HKN6_9FIRM|nr:PaaI family thioesterase [Candidatus Avidehalobacter gallistercoris]